MGLWDTVRGAGAAYTGGIYGSLANNYASTGSFWGDAGGGGGGGGGFYDSPGRPMYIPGWNPGMEFAPELDARLGKINLNTTGLDKFRGEATRSGPSFWASLMTNKSLAEEAAAKDRAVSQSRAGVRTAEADLASKGGLSSGARERIARSGARDLLAVGQDVARQGNLNRMQIGVNDEQNRIQQLSMLPGMESSAYNDALKKESMWDAARKSDIDAAVQENARRQQYNNMVYQEQMRAWAANRQAQATENSGKK